MIAAPGGELDELSHAEGATRAGVGASAEGKPSAWALRAVMPALGIERAEPGLIARHELGKTAEEQGADKDHGS
jgi:hypothetical protein